MAGAVLTRGVNSAKFEVGERVLCFEPDPTKVKVLYDAKILEIKWTRNESGKRVPEYLVHFNYWNRRWDRWAPEDYVMPKNAENAELQWKLQMEAEEKAMKGKKRRRKPGESMDNGSKRHLLSDSVSGDGESEDSSVSEGNPVEELCQELPDFDEVEEIPIPIPDSLKTRLEDDCYSINCLDQLAKLPSEPNVISILEEYLQYFGVRHPDIDIEPYVGMAPEAVVPPPLPHQNFKVCREFLDGIRVLFDFLIFDHLLYEVEKEQYLLHVAKPVSPVKADKPSSVRRAKEEAAPPVLEPVPPPKEDPSMAGSSLSRYTEPTAVKREEKMTPTPPRRVTRRLSAITTKAEMEAAKAEEQKKRSGLRHSRRLASLSSPPSSPSVSPPAIPMEAPVFPDPAPTATPARPVARPTEAKPDPPPKSRSREQRVEAEQSKDEQVKGTQDSRVQAENHPLFENLRLLAKDAHYNGQVPPCRMYGGMHLLRLFVKLPEIIAKMNLPPKKQKPLQKHAEIFLRYLATEGERNNFFPEGSYTSSKSALKGH